MKHDSLVLALTLSLAIGLPLGILLFAMWARFIFKRLLKSLEKNDTHISLDVIAMKTLFYCFPGLLLLILSAAPGIYFNSLLKQEDYCKELIRANKGISKTDETLEQRCGKLDIDALFESVDRANQSD
jgi:site-specific recombinase